MREVEYSVVVACPLAKAWKTFLDFNRWATRCGIYSGITWVHGQPWQAQSRALLDMTWPEPAEVTVKIISFESGHSITALYHGNGITSSQTVEFHPESAEETHVSVRSEFTGKPFVSIGEDVGKVLSEIYERTFADFRSACESHLQEMAELDSHTTRRA